MWTSTGPFHIDVKEIMPISIILEAFPLLWFSKLILMTHHHRITWSQCRHEFYKKVIFLSKTVLCFSTKQANSSKASEYKAKPLSMTSHHI